MTLTMQPSGKCYFSYSWVISAASVTVTCHKIPQTIQFESKHCATNISDYVLDMTNADKRKVFYSYLDKFIVAVPTVNVIRGEDFNVCDSTVANMCCEKTVSRWIEKKNTKL